MVTSSLATIMKPSFFKQIQVLEGKTS
jgi:hypothetical protein